MTLPGAEEHRRFADLAAKAGLGHLVVGLAAGR